MISWIEVDGHSIKITNPEKVLWPDMGIRKIDYLKILIELSPYLLTYTTDHLLMLIRFPGGVTQPSFYQKKAAAHTPEWVDRIDHDEDQTINLNSRATLAWLGNGAALEFHTAFSSEGDLFIPNLVFDLDPSEGQEFYHVIEVALVIHEELEALHIKSYAKTSGATGLQIFIPIEKKYSYEEGRRLNDFFGQYFAKKYPSLMTIERSVKKRGKLLYFDYLQMAKGKTIISVYSPRAVSSAAVSTSVTWEELEKGFKPSDFNLFNIVDRIKEKGDLFEVLSKKEYQQNLDFILQHALI